MTGVPVAWRVETDRLSMRPWSPDDAPIVRAALDGADQYLRPWIPWMRDEPRSMADTTARLRMLRTKFEHDEEYRYAIFDRQSGELLGGTGLYLRLGDRAREIGYWVTPASAGRGLATEATSAMIRVAFELSGVDRIEIHCSPENAPSAAIPAKLGFVHEATLRRRFVDSEGTIRDTMIWTLFASEYPASPARALSMHAYAADGRQLIR